ncbi:hypothetical protein LGQ02_07495 [Bacillus shivajii]|uniref:hypothetical protein n=1 Tax=Bacillus shivajii TaxID=1983719 RepID=UPI001CFB47CA|nr:hypothetical protein [Bacillus shivajii]UCZ54587.1 hypothetical protein LGQ02_07495 [Bacillus shivajii]
MLIDLDGLLLAYLISLTTVIFGSIMLGKRLVQKEGRSKSFRKVITTYLLLIFAILTAFFFAAYPVTFNNFLAVWSLVGSIAAMFGLGFLVYYMQYPKKSLVKALIQSKAEHKKNNQPQS